MMTRQQLRLYLIVCGLVVAVSAGLMAYGWIRGGHRHWISAAAFNADGTLLVTAGGEDHLAEIILWDVGKSRKVARRVMPRGRPRWIRFRGEDRQFVLSCDMVGQNWDDFKPNEIIFFGLDRGAKTDAFVEPDLVAGTLTLAEANTLVVYGRRSIELRELAQSETTMLMADDATAEVDDIAVSPDERFLAAACAGSARVWDLQTRKELLPLDSDGVKLGRVTVADGGNFVAAAHEPLTWNVDKFPVYFWNREEAAKAVNVVQFDQPVTRLQFLPGATPRLLIVTGKEHLENRVALFDPAGQQLEELYSGDASIDALDVSRDGTQLVWADSRHRGELWKLAGDQPLRVWQKKIGDLRAVYFSPDARVFAGHGWGPDVWLHDASTGNVTAHVPGYQVSSFALRILYYLPLLVLFGMFEVARKWMAKQRKENMLLVAKQLGWQHTSGALPDGIPEFDFFAKRGGGRFEHVLLGAGDRYDTLLAVYSWVQSSGESKTPMKQLCVIFPHVADSLPHAHIRPESLIDRLAEYIRYSDVDLDGSKTLEDFSSKYVLRSQAPELMPDLINESLAAFLCDHEGWSIEIVDGSVLMWWQVVKSFTTSRFSLSDPAEIRTFADEAREIVELLVPSVSAKR